MQIESLNHSMAEYLDIVDENGIPTGETVERETAHAKGIRHRTVHLWLVRKKDGKLQVLLQRRAKHKESFPDRYDTSSAGHIPAGSDYRESAIRELFEELGVHAKAEDLVYCGTRRVVYDGEFCGKRFTTVRSRRCFTFGSTQMKALLTSTPPRQTVFYG